jgi:hypothetical protein
MKRAFLAGLASVMMAGQAVALDMDALYRDAYAGKYEAQKTLAIEFAYGDDGQPKSALQACVWRSIVAFTQRANVDENDAVGVSVCQHINDPADAEAKVKAVMKKLPPLQSRTVESDIAELSARDCPADDCKAWDSKFEPTFRAAASGDVEAMLRLSECLSLGCNDEAWPDNGLQACVWAKIAVMNLGKKATSEARRRELAACSIVEGPVGDRIIQAHLDAVIAMMP